MKYFYFAQLNFRKNFLRQLSDENSIYVFSKQQGDKRINLTVEELVVNVKKLVTDAHSKPSTQPADCTLLVGQKVRHRFNENEETSALHWSSYIPGIQTNMLQLTFFSCISL